MSLKQQTFIGVFWSSVETFGLLFIHFIINVFFARLLEPSDFGIIGMLYVFTAIGAAFIDAGFGNALVREKEVGDLEYSSVLYFNVFLGLLIYGFFYFLAPYIATFFGVPELEQIAKFVFLVFPINALGLVQTTLLIKNLNFKVSAKISILAILISGAIGLFLAFKGYGVWALVYQTLLYALLKSLFLWIFNSWRPVLRFDLNTIRRFFGFSANLMVTNFITIIFNNLYTVIIGKTYPMSEVGYYSQSKRISEIPNQTITSVVQSVTFPVLSKLQDNDEELNSGYRKVVMMVLFLNFPIMFGLYIVADEVIYLLLTEKWMSAVPYFKLLCIYGAFIPLHSINVNILKVKGKGKKMLGLEVVRRCIMIVAILLTINSDVFTLLVGNIVASLISILINMFVCGREIKLSLFTQLNDILPYFLVSITMSLIMWASVSSFDFTPWVSFTIQFLVGVIFYFGCSIIFKLSAFNEAKNLVISNLKRK